MDLIGKLGIGLRNLVRAIFNFLVMVLTTFFSLSGCAGSFLAEFINTCLFNEEQKKEDR